MLSNRDISIIKDSALLITRNDTEIAKRMYEILFSKYPSIKSLFQNVGIGQHKKLATALSSYAVNIDKLDLLRPALFEIAKVHVARKIENRYYPMIGLCLIQAIEDILHTDATPEFIDAWREAYKTVAQALMDIENEMRLRDKTDELVVTSN